MTLYVLTICMLLVSGLQHSTGSREGVDWDILTKFIRAYMCKGDKYWYQKIKTTSDLLKYLQILLKFYHITICEVENTDVVTEFIKKDYIPLLRKYAGQSLQCHRRGFLLFVHRMICCKEVISSVQYTSSRLFLISNCSEMAYKSSFSCIFLGYIGNQDKIIHQLHHLLSEMRICVACDMQPFDVKVNHKRTLQRHKRLFDAYSWILFARQVMMIDETSIHFSSYMEKDYYLQTLLFASEGILRCFDDEFLELLSNEY